MTSPISDQRKRYGGQDPDPRSVCFNSCGRFAVAKCICGANLCGACWWRHGNPPLTGHQPQTGESQ